MKRTTISISDSIALVVFKIISLSIVVALIMTVSVKIATEAYLKFHQ